LEGKVETGEGAGFSFLISRRLSTWGRKSNKITGQEDRGKSKKKGGVQYQNGSKRRN